MTVLFAVVLIVGGVALFVWCQLVVLAERHIGRQHQRQQADRIRKEQS